MFAFRINPHIDLLSFNSAFKNRCLLKHFIQNVLFFTKHPGEQRQVGTRVVKEETSKPVPPMNEERAKRLS